MKGDPIRSTLATDLGSHHIACSRIKTLALMAAMAMVANAQTADSTGEFWPEFDLYVGLNKSTRIFAMYTATRPESLGTYADGQTGVHVDLYAFQPKRRRLFSYIDPSRSKALMVRTGYLFSRPRNNSGTATEHMATTEATGRVHLPHGLLLSDRNRADFRWVEGAPRHRYRNRLRLERSFRAGRFELVPYGHGEVFYSFRDRGWNRFRFAGGAEVAVTKQIAVEGYVLRQNTWGSVPQFVNAVGLALQFHLR